MRPANNVFDLYRLGGSVSRLLKRLDRPKITYGEALIDLWETQPLIEIIASDEFVPLDTCKKAANELHLSIAGMIAKHMKAFRDAPEDKKNEILGEQISTYEIGELREQIQAFEYVFAAELGRTAIYFVEEVGAYKTSALVDAADLVLPKNIRDELPQDAITDIRAAGRSLAFELPTAAGFHICRAIETSLLQYFDKLGIEVPDYRNLGRYIETLQKEGKKKGVDAKVLATLDQFRELHRNPIMHPDVHLTMDEAQILFSLAQSAISAIVVDIKKLKNSLEIGFSVFATGFPPLLEQKK